MLTGNKVPRKKVMILQRGSGVVVANLSMEFEPQREYRGFELVKIEQLEYPNDFSEVLLKKLRAHFSAFAFVIRLRETVLEDLRAHFGTYCLTFQRDGIEYEVRNNQSAGRGISWCMARSRNADAVTDWTPALVPGELLELASCGMYPRFT